MSHLTPLSQQQTLAAYTFDAPICILAGAGSGKTRVITHRIAHLVKNRGVNPYEILGVTFTNKAAREMRERVERLLPDVGHYVLLGTFHGLAARFLRYYGELVSVSRDFLIYDEDDAQRLIKKIINERYDVTKEEMSSEVKKVLRFRNKEVVGDAQEISIAHERAAHILQIYHERLKKMGALDFSSILEKFLALLEHEEGLRLITERVRHVVVDEYQDISAVQAKIVHILAAHAETIAIVGDDDQSIYGWRGASAHFMQHFLQTFTNAQLFKLEDNYRSTKPILDCANAVIAHNKERLGKNLHAMVGDGPKIRLSRHFRDIQEAGFVIEQSLKLFEQHGSDFAIAVLMRTNAQSRPLEEALHKARIPYRMVGGMKFYDRKEIKDILAALRAVIYHHSDVDLLRILNALPLGIGKKTQDMISEYAGVRGLSFFETMQDDDHQSQALGNTRSKKKISSLLAMLHDMRKEIINYLPNGEVKIMRADEALIYIIDKFGFASRLEGKHDDEAESRLENIEQLVQAAVSFVESQEAYQEENDVQTFLESVALISKDESVEEEKGHQFGTITLMTLHAAKGLEYDGVFLVGLEEGILPHTRSLHGQDEQKRKSALEEERRLLYVGITRARSYLFLSFCQERFLHGVTSPSAPSRFLREIPKTTIDEKDRWIFDRISFAALASKQKDHDEEPLFQKTTVVKKISVDKPHNNQGYHIEYDETARVGLTNFKPGERVFHVTYHQGHVVSLSGDGRMARVKVKFKSDGQTRTIMATHLQRA